VQLADVSKGEGTQNRKVVKAVRDLWRSSCPIPLLKHGHLDPGLLRNMSRCLLNIFSLPEQPVQVLGHPHSKKVFPGVQRESPVFQCVHVASGPVTGHH